MRPHAPSLPKERQLANNAPLLLDVTRLIWRRWERRQPTGIDRVCLAYLQHFGKRAQAVVQHRHIRRIFDRSASTALFALLADPRSDFRRALVGGALRFGPGAGCTGKNRLYLNLGHTGLNTKAFRSWAGAANVRPIYFVHDLIPITHPQFCRAGEADKHRERMRTVLQTATGVIGNSQVTLEELDRFAYSECQPSPAAVVAPLGSDAATQVAAGHAPGRPTFVILGTIEARKNHLLLLQLWARFVSEFGSRAPRLLVIGQRGWECQEVFDLLDRSNQLKEAVIEIGRCDDETLAAHLASARALLFPSMTEGYGLPLVEALRSGVPVIASDLPVFREIAGDIPDYLDPRDEAAWSAMILSYAQEPSSARNKQLRRLAGYNAPTWDDHFGIVDSWIGTL